MAERYIRSNEKLCLLHWQDRYDGAVESNGGGGGWWGEFAVRNNYCKCIFYVSHLWKCCVPKLLYFSDNV